MACAVALDVEPHFFSKTLEKMDLCTARFLHYPPCASPTGDGANLSKAIRVGEHTDFGAFTFLLLGEGAEGLQVKPTLGGEVGGKAGGEGSDAEWLTVPPPPPRDAAATEVTCLVNTGAALARWTNDTWRATAHRVIVPTADVASRHRYSIACFIDPDADAQVAVDPRFVKPGEAIKYPPTTGLDFLLLKLREAQGLDDEQLKGDEMKSDGGSASASAAASGRKRGTSPGGERGSRSGRGEDPVVGQPTPPSPSKRQALERGSGDPP